MVFYVLLAYDEDKYFHADFFGKVISSTLLNCGGFCLPHSPQHGNPPRKLLIYGVGDF